MTACKLNWCCFGKPGSVFNFFSAHYATLLCFLYWLLLLSPPVCPFQRWANFHCVWDRGRPGPAFYLYSITMHSSSSSSVVSTWSTVLLPLETFSRQKKKIHRKQNFPFLNFAIMKCQTLLEASVGTEWSDKLSMEVNCGANLSVAGC